MAFPVRDVTLPSGLHDQANGQLDPNLLATIAGQGGGPAVTLLADTSMRSFKALAAGALAAGRWLIVMYSRDDSYRPLAVQQAVHDERYDDQPTGNQRQSCHGRSYWLKTNPATGKPYATAACPGDSNHGYAIAGDLAQWVGGRIVDLRPDCLAWLQVHAVEYGWSWEFKTVPQPEPWHLRHFTGDVLTPAVLDYEQGDDMDATQAAQLAELHRMIAIDGKRTKAPNTSEPFEPTTLPDGHGGSMLQGSLMGRLHEIEYQATKSAADAAALQGKVDDLTAAVARIEALLQPGGGGDRPGPAPGA